jgi:ATP adenylyltransferase
MSAFPPGSLWTELQRATDHALASGALQPIGTACEIVPEQGIRFLVRRLKSLRRKAAAAQRAVAGGNPFLPYDPQLFVADISSTHVGLLNKYNVVDHHLLIVTRQFEHQENLLTLDDFAALCRCLAEYPGLGFYNSGVVAGASQPHRHLQLVPTPLVPGGPELPLQTWIDAVARPGEVTRCASLGWAHALVGFDPAWGEAVGDGARGARAPRSNGVSEIRQRALTDHAAEYLRHQYQRLLRATGLPASDRRSGPYNLLVTRRWMLLVPRRHEKWEGISLNALAFAGALLVRDQRQLEHLKVAGPLAALRHAGVPESCPTEPPSGPNRARSSSD